LMSTAYEYDLSFPCAGIHQIARGVRRRLKRPPRAAPPPLRQLRMFDTARNG
jgi:hypothetical protein